MELELRSHRWTDATRRESRSLSPLLGEERPSQGPGLLHFLRGVRDAFHILFARGRTSAIGYDVKIPRGGFTFEIKTFSPGKCCAALVHAPIERAKSGSLQWKRLSRWSIIERRFWYLVSLLLSLFFPFLSNGSIYRIWDNNRVHGHKRRCTSPLWCSEKRYRHFVKCNIVQTLLKSNFLSDFKKRLCLIDRY